MPETIDLRKDLLSHLCSRRQLQNRVKWWKKRVVDDVHRLPTRYEKRLYLAEFDRQCVRKSFYYFLVNHWKTFFPDSLKKGGEIATMFPRSRMAWLYATILQHYSTSVITVNKVRQAPMATHESCAYFTWKCLTQPGRMVLFHSIDKDRAGWGSTKGNPECLLGRVKWGYLALPPHLRSMVKFEEDHNPARPQAIFWHYREGWEAPVPSYIRPVPDANSASVINQFSPSDIFDDEIGHQSNPEAFWNAAIPAMGGRQFVRVGTADSQNHPDAHAHMVRECLVGDGKEPPFVEMMPYSDSFQGNFLRQILENETGYEPGWRFMGRVRNNNVINIQIHSRARAGSQDE